MSDDADRREAESLEEQRAWESYWESLTPEERVAEIKSMDEHGYG